MTAKAPPHLARLLLGRTIRIALNNPAPRIVKSAWLVGAFGAAAVIAGGLFLTRRGGLVVTLGVVLLGLAVRLVYIAGKVMRHPRFEIVLTRRLLELPTVPFYRYGNAEILLADIVDLGLTHDGQTTFWAVRLENGAILRVPADLIPEEQKHLELLTRIAIRVKLARKGSDDRAALAAVEAQVLADGPTLGAVVAEGEDGPEVLAVVSDADEWARLTEHLPADHKLYVPDDLVEPLRAEVFRAVMTLAEPTKK